MGFLKSCIEAGNGSEEATYVSVNGNYLCGRLNKMEISRKLIYEITSSYIDGKEQNIALKSCRTKLNLIKK